MKLTSQQYEEALALGFTAKLYGSDRNPFTPFGEACANDCAFDDIKNCRTDTPDAGDMEAWNIDAAEWVLGQVQAIENAIAYYEAFQDA